MEDKNLFVDWYGFTVDSCEEISLKESSIGNASNFLRLSGTFQEGNTPNQNKRIYITELLKREVELFQKTIENGLSLGKAYHPDFWSTGGVSGVKDVAIRITKLWMEGNLVKGELLVLKTDAGKEIEAIYNGGGKVGISSRGYGTSKFYDSIIIDGTEYKNVSLIGDDYKLKTFDIVLDPSVKAAILDACGYKKKKKREDAYLINKPIVNENDIEEEKSIMTLEEFKKLHPEIYTLVRDAGIEQGKTEGMAKAKEECETISSKALNSKNEEIDKVKKDIETLTTKITALENENSELKKIKNAFEAEQLLNSISCAVKEAIGKSQYKKYFKEETINDIIKKVTTVEDATKEVESYDKVFEGVIAIYSENKNTSSILETKSTTFDTSQIDLNESKQNITDNFKADQARLAFC